MATDAFDATDLTVSVALPRTGAVAGTQTLAVALAVSLARAAGLAADLTGTVAEAVSVNLTWTVTV